MTDTEYKPELAYENLTPFNISIGTRSGAVAELDRMSLDGFDEPVFWFARINAKKEHQGDGTFLMRRICDYVDSLGVSIINCVNPYGSRSLADLISWFEQFGFTKRGPTVIERKPRCANQSTEEVQRASCGSHNRGHQANIGGGSGT